MSAEFYPNPADPHPTGEGSASSTRNSDLAYRVDHLERQNDQLLATLNSIYSSMAWKTLQRFRRGMNRLLPAGTQLRRLTDSLLIWLKGRQQLSPLEVPGNGRNGHDTASLSHRVKKENSCGSKKVLLLGMAPLPWEDALRNYAPGRRTWQFLKPLRDDGHEVHLVAARIPRAYRQEPRDGCLSLHGFQYHSLSGEAFRMGSYVRNLYESLQPDCIVSVNAEPGATAAAIGRSPIWADLNGHVMAEGQSKAFRLNDDGPVPEFLKLEYPVICNADVFSAVSEAQSWALIGELGLIGRLNRFTDSYQFCHVIPNALEGSIDRPAAKLLRGTKVDEDDFVILWTGGFNTWCDYELLAAALEDTMSRFKNVKFVATGGQIDGHDDVSYGRFGQLIAKSEHRERFIMEGWIPNHLLPHYYFESDIGINVDRDCYEVRLGSKNRILDWISAGLPPVCSKVCELSVLLEGAGIGFVYPAGSKEALIDCLSRIIQMPRDERQRMRERVTSAGMALLNFERVTMPLRKWVRTPNFAPDRGRYIRLLKQVSGVHGAVNASV